MFQRLPKRILNQSNLWLAVALAMWGSLILSLQGQAQHLNGITDPESIRSFADGIRSAFPLLAGFLSLSILALLFRKKYPIKSRFLGPLGLMSVYGLVGLIGTFRSPDESMALYWSAVYLSVPLVLFATMFGLIGPSSVTRIVQFNWIALVSLIGLLLLIALIKLNLLDFLTDPASLLQCPMNQPVSEQSWFMLTSEVLRSTGVGRYAALVAIISVSTVWNRRSAPFWSFVLVAATLILLTSGARTAMVGLAFAAPLVVALNWGKKGILIGTIILVSLFTIVWGTGEHRTFFEYCLKLDLSQKPIPDTIHATKAAHDNLNLSQKPVPDTIHATKTARDNLNLSQKPVPDTIHATKTAHDNLNLFQESVPDTIHATKTAREKSLTSVTQVKTDQTFFPDGYFTFSGRTRVWKAGLELVKDSPLIGYGFHADRALLNTHMHNTYIHALLQAGTLGFFPLIIAVVWTWINVIKLASRINHIPLMHRQLIIQCAGFVAFFSVRTLTESSGAFFGVDWLLLAPIMLYLQLMTNTLIDRPVKKHEPTHH